MASLAVSVLVVRVVCSGCFYCVCLFVISVVPCSGGVVMLFGVAWCCLRVLLVCVNLRVAAVGLYIWLFLGAGVLRLGEFLGGLPDTLVAFSWLCC